VYDRDGQILAAFPARLAQKQADMSRTRSRNSQPQQIQLDVPVVRKGTRLGTVQLSAMTEDFPARAARFAGIVLLGAMGALVLGAVATGHRALVLVNSELRRRAGDLESANRRLQVETEERLKIEEALHKSLKMEAVEQLSGGIAHDLNNYLAVVRASLNILKRRLAQGKEDYQTFIHSAEVGVDRASALTKRIVSFARRRQSALKVVDLGCLLEDMADLIKRSVGENVGVHTSMDATWHACCDTGELEAVLLNLAINARDAMPDGGKFFISTRDAHLSSASPFNLPEGDYVELAVRDTGTGMTEEVRTRALEPFFTTKAEGKGTGLGLSMAHSFAKRSGGGLFVESSPGVGTTVRTFLPRHATHAPTTLRPGQLTTASNGSTFPKRDIGAALVPMAPASELRKA
jgi:signal transduction histidine kinase